MADAGKTEAPETLWPGAEDWLAELRDQRRVSPHTLSNYERDLRRLQGLANGAAPADLTALDLRRFVGRLHAGGLSGRSIARTLSAWRGLLRWLARRGVLDANVAEGLRAPKHPKRLPDALSVDEAFRLLNPVAATATDGENPKTSLREHHLQIRDQAIYELFYSSGVRLSELVGLNLDCLPDLRQGEVRVLGKRNKTRVVPVGKAALNAIEAWLAVRGQIAKPDETALFVGPQGKRISPRMIQLRLQQHGQRQGLPQRVHPHQLRHSFATHMLQGSGDLRAVQELLGHASIASTQVYTHLDFQHLAQVYDQAHPRAHRAREAAVRDAAEQFTPDSKNNPTS
ncbi:MAG: tyrosine recombinase XerC [Pseudomonadota bacterium]|jgi:integrase/recombinase XerC